jgi:hypothetical protein
MAGRQAKILHEQQINDLLVFASATRNPLRNKLIVLLSVIAGADLEHLGAGVARPGDGRVAAAAVGDDDPRDEVARDRAHYPPIEASSLSVGITMAII